MTPPSRPAVDELARPRRPDRQVARPVADPDPCLRCAAERQLEVSVRPRPLGTNAPITNQMPRITSAHGQYVAMSSPGSVPIRPVVLASRIEPTTIQATGQVNAHSPP